MPHSIDTMRTYGTGHLSQRTNSKGIQSWYGQWWIGDRKISRKLGTVRRPGSSIGLTPKQAEHELRKKMAEVELPPQTRQAGTTFTEASRVYRLHLKRGGRKRTTIAAVESCLRVWVIPFFRSTPMDRVTYQQVEDLIALMEHRGLTAKSIQNYIGTLGALYTYGLNPRRAWATSNPVDGVELPAVVQSQTIRFLTLEEVDALIRAIPTAIAQPRGRRELEPNVYAALDRVLYRVAAMTGLREGELIALKWHEVDWPTHKIRVRFNYVLGEFDTPKSRRGSRAVPLADEVAKTLAAWQPHNAADDDLVFAEPLTAGPLNNAAILRRLRWALSAAGLNSTHVFHDLRHTFGTRMAAAGVPMRTLQEWMGHRDIQTTMRYADYAPSKHEAQMVNEAFATPQIPEGDSEGELNEPQITEGN